MLPETWHLLSLVFAVLAMFLQIAGIASPLWIWLSSDGEYIGVGLFYRIGLENDGVEIIPPEFLKVKFDSEVTMDEPHWEALMVLEIIVTVFAVFLIPLIYVFYRRFQTNTASFGLFRLMFWITIFSWAPNIAGLMIFLIYHGDALSEAPDVSDRSFCWSGFMCACCLVIHIFISIAIKTRFLGGTNSAIPAAADPKMTVYPSTKNGQTNSFFQAYYSDNKPQAIEDVPQRPAIMPPSHQNLVGRRDYAREIPRSPPQIADITRRPSSPARFQPVAQDVDRGRDIYRNHSEFRHVGNGVAASGFDNRGFVAHSSPVGVQRHIKSTVLERRSQFENMDHQGIGEEVVFNRIHQQQDQGMERRRSSLYRELNAINGGRKQSGDFLVTAKHSTDRDVHRDVNTYLSHTNQPMDSGDQGQRLVLSPSNFTESNVKYNPEYMYRPYSETAY